MATTFLCIGDCHFRLKRLAEGATFIEWVTTKAASLGHLDAIVILGDLLHTFRSTHVEPFGLMTRLVTGCAAIAPTYVIVGNHDYPGPAEYQTDRHFMVGLKSLDRVVVVDQATTYRVGRRDYVMMPYLPYGRLMETLKKVRGWRECGLVFGHQPVRSVDPAAEVWSEHYPMLVSGHIHDHQKPQKNVLYVGSVSQVAINENPDKYVWVLKDSAEDLVVKKMRVPTRGVCGVLVDLATLKTKIDPSIVARHDLHVVIECSAEERSKFESSALYTTLSKTKGVTVSYRATGRTSLGDASPKPRSFDDILKSLVATSDLRVARAYALITGKTTTKFVEVPS